MIKWIALLPGLLMTILMAFCAGLQVAMMYGSKGRFVIGKVWLISDLVGIVIGAALVFAARRFV